MADDYMKKGLPGFDDTDGTEPADRSGRASLRGALGIRARLWSMALASGLGIAVVAGVGLFAIERGRVASEAIVSRDLAALQHLGELKSAVGDLANAEMQMVVNFQVKSMVASSSQDWHNALKAAMDAAKAVDVSSREPAVTQKLNTLMSELQIYGTGFDGFIAKISRGEIMSVEAGNVSLEPYRQDFHKAQSALDESSRIIVDAASSRRQTLFESSSTAARTLTLVAAVIVLLVVALAWNTYKSIWLPLVSANKAFARIAVGDMHTPVPVAKADEMGRMLSSLESMRQELCTSLIDVQHSVAHVAEASSEIAAGNSHLSERTERAAANLQETLSVIVEVDEACRQSAKSGSAAEEIANTVSNSASLGQQAVSVLSASMTGIERGAKRIADVTESIDRIAAQTHVLSMNAAITGAQSGERNRGFAVVSAEIRKLASECANAARQIRSLSDDTGVLVRGGVASMVKAEMAIRHASEGIDQVGALIRQIAESTRTQSAAMGQVRESLVTLDGKFQHDAAMVEQYAAATERLSEEATHMRGLIGKFSLTPV